jgi:hypothetical protein
MKDNWIAIPRDACTCIDDWIKSNPKERLAGEAERVVYVLFKRANDNVGAILCLNNNGYSETAMGLARITIELLVDIMMINKDENNVQYLKEYAARTTKKIFELTKDTYPQNERIYNEAVRHFESIVAPERRNEKNWKRNRRGKNLRDVRIELNKEKEYKKEYQLKRMYNEIVTQEQVYLHGGLLPERYAYKAQEPDIFIGINALLLHSITDQCKKIFHSVTLPEFDDIKIRFHTLLTEAKGEQEIVSLPNER